MDDFILSGDISVRITRSRRARRMSLRISRLKGEVRLTIPQSCPIKQAQDFVREKEGWIRKHLADLPQRKGIELGGELMIGGEIHPIVEGAGKRILIQNGQVEVPKGMINLAPRLQGMLKQMARERLISATDHYATQLGRKVDRITLRDTRSRWGSCSYAGNINYSWRLVMAPPDVLNYVAAHEVAHLIEMNHSADFWAVVERLYPNYDTPRQWLRAYGEQLHAYDFGGS